MTIHYTPRSVALQGVCQSAEAEELLQWLQKNPKAKVSLKDCEHLHTAVLQVLLLMKPVISVKPRDKQLTECLTSLWEK